MRVIALAVLAVCSVVVATAQNTRLAEFEVASIKRSATDTPSSLRTLPSGELIASSMRVQFVVGQAYDYDEVVGMPAWGTDLYDVHVKPPAGASREQIGTMWRSLVASRMKFSSHYETREAPGYALVIARSDGKLGPELKPATIDCAMAGTQSAATGRNPVEAAQHCELLSAPGLMVSGSVLVDRFSFYLRAYAGRPVTDATGLHGRYAVLLTYSIPPPPGNTTPSGTPDAPDLFTALQEQLGLKLQSSTAKIQVLVIDHIERPSEN